MSDTPGARRDGAHHMRIDSVALLAATAAAIRPPASALRAPIDCIQRSIGRIQRSRTVLAQYGSTSLPAGWTTGVDPSSGANYYYNELTGESQWKPPQEDYTQQDYAQHNYAQQGHAQYDAAYKSNALPAGWITGIDQASGANYFYNELTGESQWEPPAHQGGASSRALWRVCNARGWGPRYDGEYKLRNGDEQVLGRFDMFPCITRPWVSREQCRVLVEADGTALMVSTGKPFTGWRAADAVAAAAAAGAPGAPWLWLKKDEMHLLSHGDQISLDYQDSEGTVFCCDKSVGDGILLSADDISSS